MEWIVEASFTIPLFLHANVQVPRQANVKSITTRNASEISDRGIYYLANKKHAPSQHHPQTNQ
jgi:hypothetical protein